jgi:hypothetical protein
MRIGVKSSGKTHSLGHKTMLAHSIGKKIGGIVMGGQNASSKGQNTPLGIPESNMIYNKSNLGQYYPLGRKTIPSTKKSYLEKR